MSGKKIINIREMKDGQFGVIVDFGMWNHAYSGVPVIRKGGDLCYRDGTDRWEGLFDRPEGAQTTVDAKYTIEIHS